MQGAPKLQPWHLLLAIAATLAYRVWVIDASGITLFIDEAYYWTWAQDPAWAYYSKPPMVAWLIAASTALFGDGVLGVKALSLALYGLTAWMVYGLGQALFNRQVGLMAGLLWNFSFTSGLLGLVVSTDALLLFFWTAALWAAWRALERGHWRDFAWLGLVLGLGVLSKYTMLAFGVLVPWLLLDLHRRFGRIPLRYWLGGLLTLAVMLAWLLPHAWASYQQGLPTLRHTMEITVVAEETGGWGTLLTFWVSQLLMLSPLPLVYLVWSRWRQGTVKAREVTFLAVPALGLLAIVSLQAFNARAGMNWAAPAFISLALLFCHAVQRHWLSLRHVGRVNAWGLALVLNLGMALGVVHWGQLLQAAGKPVTWQSDVLSRMKGWDTLFERARPLAEPYRQLPVLGMGRYGLTLALYHWRDWRPTVLAWNPSGSGDDQYQLSTRLEDWRGRDMLWVELQPLPEAIAARFQQVQALGQVQVQVSSNRQLSLYVYRLQGFRGYRD